MQVYQYDENYLYIRDLILSEENDMPENCTMVRPVQMDGGKATGFYKPRYNPEQECWEEAATEEDILAVTKPGDLLATFLSNKELSEISVVLLEASVDLYEQNLSLQEQSLQTMLAVTELFEMLVDL